MLQVIFTQLEELSFPTFEKIDFLQAVEESERIEKKCREEKKQIMGNFYLIEEGSNGTVTISL